MAIYPQISKVAEDAHWSVSGDTSDTASKLRVAEVAEVNDIRRTLRQAEEVFLTDPAELVDRT